MYIINDDSKNKFDKLNNNNFYVVIDFDRTISTVDSSSTFGLYTACNYYPSEFNDEIMGYFNYYRPIELDPDVLFSSKYEMMEEWWKKCCDLAIKFQVKESDINKILTETDLLKLRDGVVDFFRLLHELNVPVIINSAGIGNFITEALKLNDCYFDNIFVHSNMFFYKDDKAYGYSDKIIHSMNKYDIELPNDVLEKIKNKNYALVIGDQLSDLYMADNLEKEDIISFGFLESGIKKNEALFLRGFDVVLKNNESFDTVSKILSLK